MSDNEMQSIEKGDTRTVSIRAEIWHALLEIAGRQIDPENAEVSCRFGQVVDHTYFTPIFRTSVTASADFILPEVLEAAFGLNSAIFPRQLERRFGKSPMVRPAILMRMYRFDCPDWRRNGAISSFR